MKLIYFDNSATSFPKPDKVIEAVNSRIQNEWLVTKYTYLTNLSRLEAVEKALLFTRTIIVHFTMSEPRHAIEIMGYKNSNKFGEILENIKSICRTKEEGKHFAAIKIVFIVEPDTAPFIHSHYKLFKDIKGLESCIYKAAFDYAGKLISDPNILEQKERLMADKGEVKYEWQL